MRALTRSASSVAAGPQRNRGPTRPVKLPGMALGLTRRTRAHPVDLENLAYAAHEFREALIPLQGITPDRCDAAATELRDRALVAEQRFFAAIARLRRRERTLAGHWENAAVMRYRYRSGGLRARRRPRRRHARPTRHPPAAVVARAHRTV